MEMDTIAAISTAMGEGAIGIVRLSGEDAIEIANKVYEGKDPLHTIPSHTIVYGYIVDPVSNERIEEAMVSVMKSPRTFTRENIVEINCHGGLLSVNRVLELVLRQGARLAEPGEFTKRAFLNGRIDLSQAEAVMDLIRAKTDESMAVALDQVEGRLSNKINELRQALIETVAHVEVNIDYPEYDAELMTNELLKEKATFVRNEINSLLNTASQGKILREGLSTVIIGRPNVGKSSLLNSLVRENKAIVTDIPGTTRDVIEEYVNIRGIPLKLVDTAGIRETEDIVERIGVERSREVLKKADLILFVLNYGEKLTEEDKALFQAVQHMNTIVIINKIDMEQQLDLRDVKKLVNDRPLVSTSLIEDKGIEELEEAIASLFFQGKIEGKDMTYVTNTRHIALLEKAKKYITEALEAIEMGVPIDLVQIDMTRTWELLGEIVGDHVEDGLIDQLFSQFCLGK